MKKIVATILATAIVASPVYVSADNHSNRSNSGTSQNMFGQNTTSQNMTGQNMMGQNMTGQNMMGQNMTGQNMMGQNMTGQNMMGQNMMGNNVIGNNMMVQNIPQQTLTTVSRGYGAVNSMASLPSISAVSPAAKWVGYGIVSAVVAGAIIAATKTTSSHTASNH